MTTNPILEELYEIRSQILAEHGGDLASYLRSASERTKTSGHPVAKIKQRTIRGTGAAKSGELPLESLASPSGQR